MRRHSRDNQRDVSLGCVMNESKEYLLIVMGPIVVWWLTGKRGREEGRKKGRELTHANLGIYNTWNVISVFWMVFKYLNFCRKMNNLKIKLGKQVR